MLSKDELLNGLITMGVHEYEVEELVDRCLKLADDDDEGVGAGTIEFSEWCIMTMDKHKMLSQQRIENVFNVFDIDKKGSITLDDLRRVFKFDKDGE